MATSRLVLYNIGLRAIGERSLNTLSDDAESRRLLDEVWSSGNGTSGNSAVRYCLEQGFWKHAMRAVELGADSGVSVEFGFSYAFAKPSDFVKLDMLSGDETFSTPLGRYEFERDNIFADVDPLYMRFVSDHADYGGDLTLWPESFTLWAGHWMGMQVAPRLKSDIDMERLEKRTKQLLADARAKDGVTGPARVPPLGNWASSRFGTSSSFRDRGPRNRLIS